MVAAPRMNMHCVINSTSNSTPGNVSTGDGCTKVQKRRQSSPSDYPEARPAHLDCEACHVELGHLGDELKGELCPLPIPLNSIRTLRVGNSHKIQWRCLLISILRWP